MVSRRRFLQGFAASLAGLQQACTQRSSPAASVAATDAGPMPGGAPLHELPPPDPLVHALKRLTFGVAQADLERARAIGLPAWVEEQLAPESLPDQAELLARARYPYAHLPAAIPLTLPDRTAAQVKQQLREKTLFLATYSRRQLYEAMVDFWTNHFNVTNDSGALIAYKAVEDAEAIRPNALADFRALLHASAKSPAMIVYLDNLSNTKSGPNENYARELTELHTLGIGGGYTERDIKEVARCFTGWSVDAATRQFRFNAALHDDGEKTVLGRRLPAGGGVADGEAVLDLLAAHPSTARFVATKLARRFVADEPPPELVDRLAEVFRTGGGDVPALVRALVADPEFPRHPDAKFHRPMEFIAGATRALAPDPNAYHGPAPLDSAARMGHAPHGWITPDGYPDRASYWLSATGLLERWNFASRLAESRDGQGRSHVQAVVGTAQTAQSLVDLLAERLVRRPLAAADRAALASFAGDGDPARPLDGDALRDRAEAVAGLLLASPYFVLR